MQTLHLTTRPAVPRLEALARQVQTGNGAGVMTVTNEMTGDRLGEVPRCTPDDVAAAAQHARSVQPGWAALPIRDRAVVPVHAPVALRLNKFQDRALLRTTTVLPSEGNSITDILTRHHHRSRS